MSLIDFSISYMDGLSVSGKATRLFVKDAATIMTLGNHHAPLVSTLSDGVVVVHLDSGEKAEYAFHEGFLNCDHNRVSVTILS